MRLRATIESPSGRDHPNVHWEKAITADSYSAAHEIAASFLFTDEVHQLARQIEGAKLMVREVE